MQKQHNDIQPLKYYLTRDWDEKSQGTDYIEKILSDSNTIEDILICIEQERRVYKKLEKDWELTTYQVLPNSPTLS